MPAKSERLEKAEKAAEECNVVAWRTSKDVCLKQGNRVIRLSHDEAERLAKGILVSGRVA